MPLTEPLPYMLRETRRTRLAEVPLLAEAVRWFEHCRMLRDFENKHLLAQPRDEDLRAHRVVIADLIADGEILAWQARQTGTDFSAVGFKIEDIEAETRLCGTARVCSTSLCPRTKPSEFWRLPLASPQLEAILEAMFEADFCAPEQKRRTKRKPKRKMENPSPPRNPH